MKFTKKCKTCDTGVVPLFGGFKVKIKAADGERLIPVCTSCAATLEGLRQLKNGKELKDDEVKYDEGSL